MGFLASIIVGLIAGWLASLIMKAKGGLIIHLILGVVGSILGGWITGLITGVNLASGLNLTSIIVSVIGAILVILIYRFFKRK